MHTIKLFLSMQQDGAAKRGVLPQDIVGVVPQGQFVEQVGGPGQVMKYKSQVLPRLVIANSFNASPVDRAGDHDDIVALGRDTFRPIPPNGRFGAGFWTA
jgi:hypothetical protein